MFVACNMPQGLIVDHQGQRIEINGGANGLSALDLVKNGEAPDTALRYHGWGITELTGPTADAFHDWMGISAKGDGPVKFGQIEVFDKLADAQKEVRSRSKQRSGFDGLDPDKDLPQGVEKADDKTA